MSTTTELLTDIRMNVEALGDMPDAQRMALGNVWAFMEAVVEKLADHEEQLIDQNTVINELIDQNENVLQPEMTGRIVGVFEIGKLVCSELLAVLAAADLDDLTTRRIEDLVQKYRRTATEVTIMVGDVTLDVDELLENEDGGEDDDEDDVDDDAPEDEGGDEVAVDAPEDEGDVAPDSDAGSEFPDEETPVEIPSGRVAAVAAETEGD